MVSVATAGGLSARRDAGRQPGRRGGRPVGVLALQGDVAEHAAALRRAGAAPVEVRRPAQLGAWRA